MFDDRDLTQSQLRRKYENLREQNNPRNEPTGDHTGRCHKCGSKSLWTDNLAYGCRDCGMIRT